MDPPIPVPGAVIQDDEDSIVVPRNYMYDMPLYKAALRGDWESAKRIFDTDPRALTAQLGDLRETALHVAASTGHSISFVQNLVAKMPQQFLWMALIKDLKGKTTLHNAAIAGNTEAAKILVQNTPALVKERNNKKYLPLHLAAMHGNKETIQFLLQVTIRGYPRLLSGFDGFQLVSFLIDADFYGIAVYILKRYPELAIIDDTGETALLKLANKPQAFESGSELGCWERVLYRFCVGSSLEKENAALQDIDVENQVKHSKKCPKESKQFGFIKKIQNKILMHKQAMELLKILIAEALKSQEALVILGPPLHLAASTGIHEFVTEIIKAYPPSIFLRLLLRNTIFNLSVIHRQEKVFNLIYQMSSIKQDALSKRDAYNNNLLHLAGLLKPSNKISGAALQMQRELQWFEVVEKVIEPSYKEMKNMEGKTPREVFTEQHSGLVKEGEEWMKTTAESCTIVAALVVTVVFAAAFTVPGGNNPEGIPIYLNRKSFMIFAVADALALFSSATSVLMFLGILTSRYSEKDFLSFLPKKLCIGLITLFFSIAAMLFAFSASMHIVLFRRVGWIAAPIGLFACVPVILFAFLQFPLLVEVVLSTFGPSIFRKQSNEIIM